MTLPSTPSPPSAPPSFPEMYERLLVEPLFRPWAEQLLARVPLAATSRVLDVACGTGIVARLARQRGGARGRVTAVDLSSGMIATARAIEPAIDWREGSAAALPVGDDERFDAVFCQQGLQFFPDRAAAVREMRRVLAPGGRVAIAVWRSLEDNGLFYDLHVVAERLLGPVVDVRHSFADAEALGRLLLDAGFADVRVEPVALEARFAVEPTALARLNARALTGMSAAARTMSDAERARIESAIVDASLGDVARYAEGGAIAFPTSANIATARG